ncbi:receptor-like protein 35 [Gastrolobium bilobum]|uniref:receptor-like protein 35 n=1 Tax=Gastrolobium bilobum TaxID=150636 RepID=UPI002AB2E49B|nr:receptor-like protein 35 [Gastrolobium bilobum]
MKNCEETERQALLKLKAGFTNGRDSLSSWKGEYCCKWKGISCDDLTGHVTMLDLQSSDYYARLQGKIDSSICELKHLTSLNLSSNYLEGKIPNCIGSLGQLIDLKLARNELFGVIPPNLGNLSNLQTLDLRRNDLVGVIPPTLGNLSNLQTLDLRRNKLVGLIPPTLENLSNFQILDLRHNELVGVIPPTLGNLSNLQTLFLGYNDLVSNDLEWISHLSNLRRLGLLNTTHSGAVDWLSSISKIPSLLELHLDDCGLGQVNPRTIPHLNSSTSLKTLSLSHNELDSSILSWVLNVSKVLRDINLSFNQLSGSLPIFEVTNLASLEYLDLSFNQLKGTLPYTIGKLSSLKGLYLSSIELNGVISEAHLSNLSSLKILDVSHNSISFNLSSDWIPPFQLHGLFASWCTLGPNFPAWLKHQTKLGELEISNSGISDSFPQWFWDQSSSLFYLNASHNKLSGILPKSKHRDSNSLK